MLAECPVCSEVRIVCYISHMINQKCFTARVLFTIGLYSTCKKCKEGSHVACNENVERESPHNVLALGVLSLRWQIVHVIYNGREALLIHPPKLGSGQ